MSKWWSLMKEEPVTEEPGTERRSSGGDFYDLVIRQIEAQASGNAADVSSTAAVEAAAGALSRAMTSAEVRGPSWVRDAISPEFLGQVGRDILIRGDSVHYISVNEMGKLSLLPVASFHFEDAGDPHPENWTIRATMHGPSSSITRHIPFAGCVFVKWGNTPGQRHVGTGPLSWASTTARLQSETERSLADEAGGPVGSISIVPSQLARTGEDGEIIDPTEKVRADIKAARGKSVVLGSLREAAGDRLSSEELAFRRFGPEPTETQEKIREAAFRSTLAACGTPPSLWISDDGTAQREALRRWHMNLVLPIGKLLEHELTAKLEVEVKLKFDSYPLDMVSRAQVVSKLSQVEGLSTEKIMSIVGLLEEGA